VGGFCIGNRDKIRVYLEKKDKSGLYIRLVVNCILSIFILSVLGLLVNIFNNFEAFKFQWGMISHVDSNKLNNYLSVRDIFVYLGALTGIAQSLISEYLNKK